MSTGNVSGARAVSALELLLGAAIASILAHGFIDTFGVTALYFGWDT